jgi:tetratricopeptide (TPR) repeat protein
LVGLHSNADLVKRSVDQHRMHEASSGATTESAAVAHLVALGYEDPVEAAARSAAVEQARQAMLKAAEELLKKGDVATAIDSLESMCGDASEWAAPHHLLARAYYLAGRWDAVDERLRWLECQGVEHAELALLRAKLALRKRSLDAASDQAEYAKHLHHPLPAADILLGEVEYRRGNLAAAEVAYRRAIEAPGPNAAAWAGLAAIALRRDELAEAIDWSLRAIELEPRLASAHYRLGLALQKLQRPREATAAIRAVAALSPMLAGPFRWLALLAVNQGDSVSADEFRRLGKEIIARRRLSRRA